MKKFLFFILLSGAVSVFASSPNYTINPSATINASANFNQLTIYDIYQDNIASFKIKLKWDLISQQIPAGWDYSICDYGSCYPGIPNSGSMDSVGIGSQGFLGLNINPYSISGTAIVKVFVYENGFYAQGDTLTWIISSVAPGIAENNSAYKIALFPNPASDLIRVSVNSASLGAAVYAVYNEAGQVVLNGSFSAPATAISIQDLPVGLYFVLISDEGKKKALVKFSKSN